VDPQRKRTIRLVVALSVAVLLSVALIYTSFSASTEAKEPSQLLGAAPGTSYEMTGRVVKGSIQREGSGIAFRVVDRDGQGESLPVTYTGTVPDPFRGGREIVLTGALQGGPVEVHDRERCLASAARCWRSPS
jgi:cytochrome c-type biogenesis protein CcmE